MEDLCLMEETNKMDAVITSNYFFRQKVLDLVLFLRGNIYENYFLCYQKDGRKLDYGGTELKFFDECQDFLLSELAMHILVFDVDN